MSEVQPIDAPPEVEATIARIAAHKNVQGILILERHNGIIIRSAGPLFALPPVPAAAATPSEDTATSPNGLAPALVSSELARAYAKAAAALVDSVGSELAGLEDGDDVRFLRIRTKKHELMITPDPLYILVVVQDPTS